MKYQAYPTPIKHRVGCKVSWRYYDNEADAKKAAEIALKERYRKEAQGYDFGYCGPGSYIKMTDGTFAVTCP